MPGSKFLQSTARSLDASTRSLVPDVRPISMLREIVNHSGFGMNSRKENKYRKPINDKLLIGSRDGAGRVDVTVLDIHRFESRHKPSIIIERIVNEERIFPSRENSFGGDKSFFSFFFFFFLLRHLRRDCLPGILAKNTLYHHDTFWRS